MSKWVYTESQHKTSQVELGVLVYGVQVRHKLLEAQMISRLRDDARLSSLLYQWFAVLFVIVTLGLFVLSRWFRLKVPFFSSFKGFGSHPSWPSPFTPTKFLPPPKRFHGETGRNLEYTYDLVGGGDSVGGKNEVDSGDPTTSWVTSSAGLKGIVSGRVDTCGTNGRLNRRKDLSGLRSFSFFGTEKPMNKWDEES